MSGVCYFCKKPVNLATGYQRVEGWQRKAQGSSRRSGSDIVLRKPKEYWACIHCIDRMCGVAIEQETML